MPGYQYIPSSTFTDLDFESTSSEVDVEDVDGPTLVFVDGHFIAKQGLSKQAVITSLSDAYKTYGSFLTQNLTKTLKNERDPLVHMNLALHKEAAFIYIPPKVKVDLPIKIISFASKGLVFPRVHLFASAFSSVDIAFINPPGGNFFSSEVCDLILEEGAYVNYYNQSAESSATRFSFVRAQLKKSSTLKAVVTLGSAKMEKGDFKVSLNGEESKALLYGLSTPRNNHQAHVNVHMEHVAPHTSSSQLFKGALFDASRASFEGKIYVHKEAQKTDAFQLNNHLLLSPHVIANSKPNLEIFADDVKASHGATVGQLNKESLFYLKARGLDEKSAKELLVQGFLKEILDLLPDYLK